MEAVKKGVIVRKAKPVASSTISRQVIELISAVMDNTGTILERWNKK
jgi:hypothetical protein